MRAILVTLAVIGALSLLFAVTAAVGLLRLGGVRTAATYAPSPQSPDDRPSDAAGGVVEGVAAQPAPVPGSGLAAPVSPASPAQPSLPPPEPSKAAAGEPAPAGPAQWPAIAHAVANAGANAEEAKGVETPAPRLRPADAAAIAPAAPAPRIDRPHTLLLTAAGVRLAGAGMHLDGGDANRHIGDWRDPADRAEWTLQVTRPGLYHVEAIYACAPDTGGVFAASIGGHVFTATASPTDNWDDYRALSLGNLTLAPGPVPVVVSPLAAKPGQPLMRLKGLTITQVAEQ